MPQRLRVLDTGLASARWNIAVTAALLDGADAGGPILRFHRYEPSVLLGHLQDAADVADLDVCRSQGIVIARRVTGGGAVFMTPRMLAWEVVAPRASFAGSLDAVAERLCCGIAAGLRNLGARAAFRAPQDVVIDGRKVSGTAGATAGARVLLQGTLLLDDELASMAAVLRLPEATLRASVTSLAEHVSQVPDLARITQILGSSIGAILGAEAWPDAPTTAELAAASRLLAEQAGRDAFVFGAAVPRTAPRG